MLACAKANPFPCLAAESSVSSGSRDLLTAAGKRNKKVLIELSVIYNKHLFHGNIFFTLAAGVPYLIKVKEYKVET